MNKSIKMKTNNIHLCVLTIAVISLLVTIENSQASRWHGNRNRCRDEQSNRDENSSYLGGELTCGVGYKEPNKAMRIIGGRDAKPGEFPFIVRFEITKGFSILLCSGAIIDERHILTAGHCFENCRGRTPVLHVSIFLAEFSSQSKGTGEIKVKMAKYTIHPNHSACHAAGSNDVALIELAKPIKFELKEFGYGSLNRVCMPSKEYEANTTAIIAGWGRTNPYENEMHDILQMAEVKIADFNVCQRAWAEIGLKLEADKHICAYRLTGIQSSCLGDSGGPLMVMNNGKYEVVGITSFGPPNCDYHRGRPVVYTRVSGFSSWIESNKFKPSRRSRRPPNFLYG